MVYGNEKARKNKTKTKPEKKPENINLKLFNNPYHLRLNVLMQLQNLKLFNNLESRWSTCRDRTGNVWEKRCWTIKPKEFFPTVALLASITKLIFKRWIFYGLLRSSDFSCFDLWKPHWLKRSHTKRTWKPCRTHFLKKAWEISAWNRARIIHQPKKS